MRSCTPPPLAVPDRDVYVVGRGWSAPNSPVQEEARAADLLGADAAAPFRTSPAPTPASVQLLGAAADRLRATAARPVPPARCLQPAAEVWPSEWNGELQPSPPPLSPTAPPRPAVVDTSAQTADTQVALRLHMAEGEARLAHVSDYGEATATLRAREVERRITVSMGGYSQRRREAEVDRQKRLEEVESATDALRRELWCHFRQLRRLEDECEERRRAILSDFDESSVEVFAAFVRAERDLATTRCAELERDRFELLNEAAAVQRTRERVMQLSRQVPPCVTSSSEGQLVMKYEEQLQLSRDQRKRDQTAIQDLEAKVARSTKANQVAKDTISHANRRLREAEQSSASQEQHLKQRIAAMVEDAARRNREMRELNSAHQQDIAAQKERFAAAEKEHARVVKGLVSGHEAESRRERERADSLRAALTEKDEELNELRERERQVSYVLAEYLEMRQRSKSIDETERVLSRIKQENASLRLEAEQTQRARCEADVAAARLREHVCSLTVAAVGALVTQERQVRTSLSRDEASRFNVCMDAELSCRRLICP